jgi:hypothetical protein
MLIGLWRAAHESAGLDSLAKVQNHFYDILAEGIA